MKKCLLSLKSVYVIMGAFGIQGGKQGDRARRRRLMKTGNEARLGMREGPVNGDELP